MQHIARPSKLRIALALATLALLQACAGHLPTQDTGALSSPAAPVNLAAEPAKGDVSSQPAAPRAPLARARTGLDSLNPDSMIDFGQPDAKRDLWQRIREGYGMPDLQGPLVDASEQWYSSRAAYVQRMTERGSRYLFHVLEEVQRRNMPTELALLPFIESAFNPQALSSAKASGMWQFMPATGRDFDLRQNVFRDDRRNVLASTRAALDYLSRLYAQFGHWHLALAAYNWGEGNLQRAIQRNQRMGLPTDYESLRMPDETRRYVPKLQAVKNIVMRPQSYGLSLPPLENHPYFLSVPIDRDIDVSKAAEMAGLALSDFAALNPQYNKPVILAAATPEILLPYDNAERFLIQMEQQRGPLASWTAWTAPKTIKPAEAAKLAHMDEKTLREINRIPAGMLIKKGSTLLVPRGQHHTHDVSEQVAENALMQLEREAVPKAQKPHKSSKSAKASHARKSAQGSTTANAAGTQKSGSNKTAGKNTAPSVKVAQNTAALNATGNTAGASTARR